MGSSTLISPHALLLPSSTSPSPPSSSSSSLSPHKLSFQSPLRLPFSRLSISNPISKPSSLTSRFATRATEDDGADAEADSDSDSAVAVAVAVAEENNEPDAEGKPAKKPMVKWGDIMGILNKRAVEQRDSERPIPDLRPGDIVEIKMANENKRRKFTLFKGIIISKQNAGIHTSIRIRRIVAGGGVEIVFPVYSPLVQQITVLSHRKVRRAKLYYLRDKLPRFCTFK